ncbi:protein like [Capsicum annuum]|uniref:UPF0481 protein At3g47200-like n=1 Tax=Capsicum annuum TaxID=4072 RepID=UPI001FB09B0A|nr:UPF0481 protein At3g47200-like [Capsicum annuum]
MSSENPIQMMAHYKSSIIQMVPYFMREENKENSDDYEPNVVSLGPYHHGKEKLKFLEEYFKPMAVELFIGNSSVGEDDLMVAILGEIRCAKSCYLQEFTSKYSDEEFARMMLRDACVNLNDIGPTEGHVLYKKFWMIQHLGAVVYANIGRDMYLLENQVPFQILKTLFFFIYNTHDGDKFVENVENFCFKIFFHDRDIEKPMTPIIWGGNPFTFLKFFEE